MHPNQRLSKNYGDVWYSPKAITNILCLKNVRKKHRVTYDSRKDDTFVVHKEEEKLIFKPLKNGLYVHDTTDREISLLNSVEENKTKYTKREYAQAVKAHRLYKMVGYPSDKDFKSLIKNHMIHNVQITEQDIDNAQDGFGKDVDSIKGKTTRQKT